MLVNTRREQNFVEGCSNHHHDMAVNVNRSVRDAAQQNVLRRCGHRIMHSHGQSCSDTQLVKKL